MAAGYDGVPSSGGTKYVYSFSDHTHDNLFGTKTYSSLDSYAAEAAWSRVLAGVHYKPTADVSLEIGNKVGWHINQLRFKK